MLEVGGKKQFQFFTQIKCKVKNGLLPCLMLPFFVFIGFLFSPHTQYSTSILLSLSLVHSPSCLENWFDYVAE
tara:strand:- start:10 stop:228 length:219 start_codon:yes stop_codon:yes gene_type:complete